MGLALLPRPSSSTGQPLPECPTSPTVGPALHSPGKRGSSLLKIRKLRQEAGCGQSRTVLVPTPLVPTCPSRPGGGVTILPLLPTWAGSGVRVPTCLPSPQHPDTRLLAKARVEPSAYLAGCACGPRSQASPPPLPRPQLLAPGQPMPAPGSWPGTNTGHHLTCSARPSPQVCCRQSHPDTERWPSSGVIGTKALGASLI